MLHQALISSQQFSSTITIKVVLRPHVVQHWVICIKEISSQMSIIYTPQNKIGFFAAHPKLIQLASTDWQETLWILLKFSRFNFFQKWQIACKQLVTTVGVQCVHLHEETQFDLLKNCCLCSLRIALQASHYL